MNVIKKCALTVSVLTVLALGFVGSAFAFTVNLYPDGVTANLEYYTGPAPSGMYYVTPLDASHTSDTPWTTSHTIHFMDSQNNILFTNQSFPSEFGTVKAADLGNAYFLESSSSPSIVSTLYSPAVVLAQLVENLTLPNGLSLSVGTLILAVNVNEFPSGDDNYNRRGFVLAASPTAPTPLPATVWLLGSGFAGVAALRRKFKA